MQGVLPTDEAALASVDPSQAAGASQALGATPRPGSAGDAASQQLLHPPPARPAEAVQSASAQAATSGAAAAAASAMAPPLPSPSPPPPLQHESSVTATAAAAPASMAGGTSGGSSACGLLAPSAAAAESAQSSFSGGEGPSSSLAAQLHGFLRSQVRQLQPLVQASHQITSRFQTELQPVSQLLVMQGVQPLAHQPASSGTLVPSPFPHTALPPHSVSTLSTLPQPPLQPPAYSSPLGAGSAIPVNATVDEVPRPVLASALEAGAIGTSPEHQIAAQVKSETATAAPAAAVKTE